MLRALVGSAIIALSLSTFAVAQGPGGEHQEGKPHARPPGGPPGAKPFIQQQGPPPGPMSPYRGDAQPSPVLQPRGGGPPPPGGASWPTARRAGAWGVLSAASW
jgi:hypothetical protein